MRCGLRQWYRFRWPSHSQIEVQSRKDPHHSAQESGPRDARVQERRDGLAKGDENEHWGSESARVFREVRSEHIQTEHERNRREKQRDDHMVELRGIQRISQVSDSIVGTTYYEYAIPKTELDYLNVCVCLKPVLKKNKPHVLLAP